MRSDDPPPPGDPDADLFDPDWVEPEAVELPLSDVLDLHSFPPREVKDVVRDWLDAVHAAGHRRLRIIHGRGVGVQRATVRALLERDPRVTAYGDAPAAAGGWGATWVEMD